ncbi:MAG: MCE family protein, partial [Salinivirgaceae bacterium]|nr:MCE family protein [Salinivirgaceae bacterium]
MNKSAYIKIGAIIGISLAAFIWGMNFLKGKGTFNNDDTFYVVYERIDGLEVANPVLINGFKVGQVSDIYFLPDTSGRLVVELLVKKENKVPQKSVARIFSSDLMGTKAIDLLFSEEKTLHHSGDTLIADFEGSLQEMVSVQMLPLKNKAESLLSEMEEAIKIVKKIFSDENQVKIIGSIDNIRATFANLQSSSSTLDSVVTEGKSKMELILSNVESISTNLEKNNLLISNTIQNFSNISDSVAKVNLTQVLNQTA